VAGCGANNAVPVLTPAAATARDRSWTMLARLALLQPKLQLSCLGTNLCRSGGVRGKESLDALLEAGSVSPGG